MFPRFLSAVKLLLVLFPIGSGLFLTDLGVVKLNEASFVSGRQEITSYGFLVFSSTQLQQVGSNIWLGVSSIKDDEGGCLIHFPFELSKLSNASLDEHVIGLQLPCTARMLEPTFNAVKNVTEETLWIEEEGEQGKARAVIKEAKVILTEEKQEKPSILYIRFLALPNALKYRGTISLGLQGFTVREEFSTYSIVFPVAQSRLTVHPAVYDFCPGAYAYYGDNLSLLIGVNLPENCELKRIHPFPDGEQIMPGGTRRFYWTGRSEFRTLEFPHPVSECITVTTELRSETELRNRLLFDSGLYMGLGVSLVFGGVHEALKIAIELKRKRTASNMVDAGLLSS